MPAHGESLQLALYLELGDASDDEELDRVTRRLKSEIETTRVESVQLLRDELTPEGTKAGEVVTLGALVMTILPAAIPPVLDLLKAWSLRGQNRKVRIKTEIRGRPLELEYSGTMSQAEFDNVRRFLMAE